jgi:hypothetical protein
MAWGVQRDSKMATGRPPYRRPPLKQLLGCKVVFRGGRPQGAECSGMADPSDTFTDSMDTPQNTGLS